MVANAVSAAKRCDYFVLSHAGYDSAFAYGIFTCDTRPHLSDFRRYGIPVDVLVLCNTGASNGKVCEKRKQKRRDEESAHMTFVGEIKKS